jgi:protein involved in polysaccharide export with SLBB domain
VVNTFKASHFRCRDFPLSLDHLSLHSITQDFRIILEKSIRLRFAFLAAITIGISSIPGTLKAQMTSEELYSSFKNNLGVADTATEKILARRQGQVGMDAQALEQSVDPATYILGPGDGVYLSVYAIHGFDEDLTVTPEGRLLIPVIGSVAVAGYTITEAEKRVKQALAKDYKSPDVSLSLRHLRPMKVSVVGDVLSPGIQTTTALQRVSEVVDRSGGFKLSSSLRNIEVRTPTGSLRTRADLVRYYALGDLAANPTIEGGDVIVVPSAKKYILVSGSVASPQRIEFVQGDSLSTALKLCGGLLPAADPDSIEIARFPDNDPFHTIWLWANYAHSENPILHDGDQIFIRASSQYHVPRIVGIGGEVPFPGQYPIVPGTTRIKDIIDRAGGLLPNASLDEALLIRRTGIGSTLSDAEFRRIEIMSQLRKEGLSDQQYDYYSARIYPSVMVVDFKALMAGDESQNLILRENDSISVPRTMGYVTVSGSVNKQGNVEYIAGGSWKDYITRAGGFSSTADRNAIRVVDTKTGSFIDPRSESEYTIAPGDMIIVPEEEPHFWKDFTAVTTLAASVLTIIVGIVVIAKNGL